MKPKFAGRRSSAKHKEMRALLLQKPNVIKKHLLKSSGHGMKFKKKQLLKMRKETLTSEHEEAKECSSDSNPPPELSPNCTLLSSDDNDEDSAKNSLVDPSLFQTKHTEDQITAYRQMDVIDFTSSVAKNQEPAVSSEESQSESDSDEVQEIRNFWFFESDSCETAVLVLRHPCQVVLSGCLQLRALSGSAEIHGWHLSPDGTDSPDFTRVFSTSHYGRYTLCSFAPEQLPKRVNLVKHLSARLASVRADSFLPSVLSVATSGCVVLAITGMETSWSVEYACGLLSPNLFSPQHSPYASTRFNFSVSQNLAEALTVTQEHKKIAQQIAHAIQYARSIGSPAPRIVVTGDRDTGKSTFIRYLINFALSSGACASVCHLDGDPGQSEFTPSGCITLTSVDSSLLGPPFTHQKTPVRQCFVGGPSVEDTPDLYSESFSSLMDHYTECLSTEPLFVNTMGWTRGVGLSLLVDVLRFCHPSLVIQMHSPTFSPLPLLNTKFMVEECGWMSNRSHVHLSRQDTEFRRVTAVREKEASSYSEASQLGLGAPLQRQLSALAYLSRVLANSADRQLTSVPPKCVPMEEVSVMLSSKVSVKQESVLQVINGSWVALCSVASSQVSDSRNSSSGVKKLSSNLCLGFGLVRGLDLDQKLILILTPEPLSRLQSANALAIMGDLLPIQVYTNQRSEGPVPYVSQTSLQSKSGLGVKIKQTRRKLT